MTSDLTSLLIIVSIAAIVPLIIGITRFKVAEVVLLLAAGVIFGTYCLNAMEINGSITLISELGLGLLFFLAGMELERKAVVGRSGKLAAIGWGVSMLLAGLVAGLFYFLGSVTDFLGVAIALTTTALGTLLPVLHDSGQSKSRFGTYFMGAGAWGEFGPIIAIAILLGAQSSLYAIIALTAFSIIALIVYAIPRFINGPRIRGVLNRGYNNSSQAAVRVTMLVLVLLLTIADDFGLDAVLGAFIAGIIVRRYVPPNEDEKLTKRLEAIAFGFFIPVFFIVSGAGLDIRSIIDNPQILIACFLLLLLIRGLPQFILYRKAIPDVFQRGQFALLVATGLPLLVAITSIEVDAGVMLPANAAGLVGAGALSVLVFPLLAQALGKKVRNPLPLEDELLGGESVEESATSAP